MFNEQVSWRIEAEKEAKTGKLDLRNFNLEKIPPEVKEMVWLQSLDLSGNHLKKVEGLDRLTNLYTLHLSRNQLATLEGLEGLANLQWLNLFRNHLKKVEGLDRLTNLQMLDLSENYLTIFEGLKGPSNLQTLNLSGNHLKKVEGLDRLTNLQKLDLSNNHLTTLNGLDRLTNLHTLHLSKNQLTTLEGLEGLANLQWLNLYDNPLFEINNLVHLIAHPKLLYLALYGMKENSLHIPVEHFGKSPTDNCYKLLKAYFESIKKGAAFTKEVPVILVGNSTVGKTSLRYFLKEKTFPSPKDFSTHGIEPDLWHPTQVQWPAPVKNARFTDAQIYFWDFGGQEYYHATHRLFFSREAIYVLLWDKATNKQGMHPVPIRLNYADGTTKEQVLPVELFPYYYWLNNIRFYAPSPAEAPVLVVQNRVANDNIDEDEPDSSTRKQFGINKIFNLNIKTAAETAPQGKAYREMENFLEHLLTLANTHSQRLARATHWHAVRSRLQQSKRDRLWTRAQFLTNLQLIDNTISENSMQSYLLELHYNGFIFNYEDDPLLKDYVFINPAWVTESIYTILDKSVLDVGGEFTKQHVVERVGISYTEAFVALMKKFELIFENEEKERFIAPQYLPVQLTDKAKWSELEDEFDFAAPDLVIRFPDFLPKAVMLRFLVQYGTKGRYYWRYGIAFRWEKKQVLVMSEDDSRQFNVYVRDGDKYVQRLVLDSIMQLADHKTSLQVSVDNKTFVQYSELQCYHKNEQVKAINGEMVACADYRYLVADTTAMENLQSFNPVVGGKKEIKVFVSYAHKDKDYSTVFTEEFHEYLNNSKKYYFNMFDDRDLLVGSDWNEKLEEEIANCDVGILLLSAAFLNSEYIAEKELDALFEKLTAKKDFLICPIYFRAFEFSEFEFLKKYQFFKPRGAKYEQADKGTNLCFAHLVRFDNTNGVNIARPNPLRDDYLLDLSIALFKALDEKFQG